jgi:exonuclease VII small subunit
MTRLKLKLPAGIQYAWDWHIVLTDAAGKQYEPDHGGGFRFAYTEFPLDEYDPDLLIADYNLPEGSSIVKIVVNARSHERDYYWVEFKDLPLASAAGEKKSAPVEARAADPVEAIELKVARTQLEKALGDIQQTQLDLQTALESTPKGAAATVRLQERLKALEDQAAKLRTVLREKHLSP